MEKPLSTVTANQKENNPPNIRDLVSEHPALFRFNFLRENRVREFKGMLKQNPQDFRVYEQLGFELSGEGQHLCLLIQKIRLNTQQVATVLSRFFGVHPKHIGFLGMKDRVALTEQWFSVDLAYSDLDESSLEDFDSRAREILEQLHVQAQQSSQDSDDEETDSVKNTRPGVVKLQESKRNSKKLQIGKLKGNRFEIAVRNIIPVKGQDNDVGEQDFKQYEQELEQRLAYIKEKGFPNYFGIQRFGLKYQNLVQLARFHDKNLNRRRGMRGRMISTLRAFAFNLYLSERIRQGNLRHVLAEDRLQFADGNTLLKHQDALEKSQARVDEDELVITGPLIGASEKNTDEFDASTDEMEVEVRQKLSSVLSILERYEVKPARRPLVVFPEQMHWYFSGNDLFLQFSLPAGSFATSLILECLATPWQIEQIVA